MKYAISSSSGYILLVGSKRPSDVDSDGYLIILSSATGTNFQSLVRGVARCRLILIHIEFIT